MCMCGGRYVRSRGDEYDRIKGKGPPLSPHYMLAFIPVPTFTNSVRRYDVRF